jgi:hypothetical protein
MNMSDAHVYTGVAPANRPAEDYTVRIIPRVRGQLFRPSFRSSSGKNAGPGRTSSLRFD